MSFIPINKDFIESISLEASPSVSYTSSSNGITGSINLFPNQSEIQRDISLFEVDSSSFTEDQFQNSIFISLLNQLPKSGNGVGYFDAVKNTANNSNQQKIKIHRYEPGVLELSNNINLDSKLSLFKRTIKNLNHNYSVENSNYSFSTTNYYCLNFFTSSQSVNDKALIYAVPTLTRKFDEAFDKDLYHYHGENNELVSPFTIDFYLNPRYSNDTPDSHFNAGTILHMSSTFAVSLVSGSKKSASNLTAGYRILLQLSSSADIQPSKINLNALPNNCFLSDDNVLLKNNWHRITLRWGASYVNNYTGSMWVDDSSVGTFSYSNNILTSYPENTMSTVFVGNFFEGSDPESLFTNQNTVSGSIPWKSGTPNTNKPIFRNQLNAEIHHLLLSRKYLTDYEIKNFRGKVKKIERKFENFSQNFTQGFQTSFDTNILMNFFGPQRDDILYIQPAFWPESTSRFIYYFSDNPPNIVNNTNILEQKYTATNSPYNDSLLFSKFDINEINIENFVLDSSAPILSWSQPITYNLEQKMVLLPLLSTYANVSWIGLANSANEYYYQNNVSRNLLILPCDDGNFEYDTNIFSDYTKHFLSNENLKKYVRNGFSYNLTSSYNNKPADFISYGTINLNSPVSRSIDFFLNNNDYKLVSDNKILKPFSNPTLIADNPLKVLKNTGEDSYNKFTIFNISNLFYGNSIKENSLTLSDLSFIDDKVKIIVKDNGFGSLYRANSDTPPALWSKIGNVYYNEGIVTILDPTLHTFGKNKFKFNFLGKQNVHVFKLAALLPVGKINASTNPTWKGKDYPPSQNVNEVSPDFVYITDINLHDDNYNVVMKAKLAQPIIKRRQDRFLFKIKCDF